jgi:hypothetical protein
MSEADVIRFVRAFCRRRLEDDEVSQVTLSDEVGCNLWRSLAKRFNDVKQRPDPANRGIKTIGDVYDKQFLKDLTAHILSKYRTELSRRELARRIRFTAAVMFEILLNQYRGNRIRLDERDGVLTISQLHPITEEGDIVGV